MVPFEPFDAEDLERSGKSRNSDLCASMDMGAGRPKCARQQPSAAELIFRIPKLKLVRPSFPLRLAFARLSFGALPQREPAMQVFRLFASSPSDANVARRRVETVVSRLNGECAGLAGLEAIRWETGDYRATPPSRLKLPQRPNAQAKSDLDWVRAQIAPLAAPRPGRNDRRRP
jgi:hypothetical protein